MHVLIQDGRVHDVDVDPALGSVLTVVDAAGIDPQPTVGWLYVGGAFSPPVAPPVDLKAYAAAARYARETGGITVGTAPIATDRDSQALITGMWAAAQIDPDISVSFKSRGGFVTIGAAQIGRIAATVAAHVQACFAAEAKAVAGIDVGTVRTTADVDAIIAAA